MSVDGSLVHRDRVRNPLVVGRELALPAEQVSASGHWMRGVAALDHHAPVGPSDRD